MTDTTTTSEVALSPANVNQHVGRLVIRRTASQAVRPGVHTNTQQEYLVLGAGDDDVHMFAVPVVHYGSYPAADPTGWNAGGSPEQVLYDDGPMTMRPCRTQPSPERAAQLMAWAVARQTTDLAHVRRSFREQQARLQVEGTDHGVSMQEVYDRLLREAERRSWCSEFDQVMESLGLPGRNAPYTVEVRVEVPFYVTLSVAAARNADDAENQVREDVSGSYADAIRAAIRAQVSNGDIDVNGDWDITDTTRQD